MWTTGDTATWQHPDTHLQLPQPCLLPLARAPAPVAGQVARQRVVQHPAELACRAEEESGMSKAVAPCAQGRGLGQRCCMQCNTGIKVVMTSKIVGRRVGCKLG